MTEDDARAWLISTLGLSRETYAALDRYVAMVRDEQTRQNLVSAATLPSFWSRHIVDSAQLIRLAGDGCWLDIGSGAGVPGLVTAIITGAPTTLVEPRARRAAFLRDAAVALNLTNVTVAATTMATLVAAPADIITARAVAPLPALIRMAVPFAHHQTVWLLPKGKSGQSELAMLPRSWQGEWQAQPSVTEAGSDILIGRHVKVID